MGFSTLLMGFSTPSTGKAGRASPLRDSLRSPKGSRQHSPDPGSLRSWEGWFSTPSTGISRPSLPA